MTTADTTQVEFEEVNSPTTAEKLRKLPWALGFDTANSIFATLTFFGSVFVLFLNELGFNKSQIGFLLSLLPFLVLVSLFSKPLVERLGNKKAFLIFWGTRTIFAVGLLAAPWVWTNFGKQTALVFIAAITIGFTVLKAIALTGLLPWQQEYIPNHIRGKFSAYTNIATSLASLLAVGLSGFVLNRIPSLDGYTALFSLGIFFAVVALFSASRIPGGAARPQQTQSKQRFSQVLKPLKDQIFFLFLGGAALVTLASGPLNSFLPLFMEEKVGLSSGDVVYLGIGALLGAILTGYFWGWAADRYGSRPVMITGLVLKALQALFFIWVPVQSATSMPIAMIIYFYGGFASLGWVIGSTRLLFVNIIPQEKASDYSAVYYSWMGVFGGVSALLGGWALELLSGFHVNLPGLTLDAYTILFMTAFILPIAATLLLLRIHSEDAFSVREFAGLFYHGNPLLAMESMIRFRLAKDETAVVSTTERLGRSHSPLTIDELLEALADPRFYVRFEALISIGRFGADERLRVALAEVLKGNDPALSVIAAWAMGRTRDPAMISHLRDALDSPYRSVRAHSARSLASLEDKDSIPLLEERLETETDFGLKLAYAASLGKLSAEAVLPELLSLLMDARDEIQRMEIALALARLVGGEGDFVQLQRSLREDPGTSLSRAVQSSSRKFSHFAGKEQTEALQESQEAFARNDLDLGVARLSQGINDALLENLSPISRQMVSECLVQAKIHGSARLEYPLLILHVLRESL